VTLRVWRSLVPEQARRDAARSLRRLRRRLGRARELEVHVAIAESHLAPHRPKDRTAVDAILDRIRERLARRRRRAMRRVSPPRMRRLMRRLGVAGCDLGPRLRAHPGATGDALAAGREVAEAAADALRGALEHTDDTRLHAARIHVKKWRYTLENLAEVIPGYEARTVRSLQKIQSELGDVHDRALLREEFAGHAFDPIPERERARIRALVEGLDAERERSLRRFRRLTTATLAALATAPAAARGSSASAPPPVGAIAPRPAAEAEEAAAETDDDAGRQQRWRRMASWLEESGRGE
jgi:CHAD domain-containing protein